MRRAAWLTAILPVAACVLPSPSLPLYRLSPAQITAVEAGVRKVLRDPESARFGIIRAVHEKSGEITICGYVNAKNGLGGYTGNQAYIGQLAELIDPHKGGKGTGVYVFGVAGLDSASERGAEITCRNRGNPLPPP